MKRLKNTISTPSESQTRIFKLAALFIAFLVALCTFTFTLENQNSLTNSDGELKKLIDIGDALILADWQVEMLECSNFSMKDCRQTSKISSVNFPLQDSLETSTNPLKRFARATITLDETTRAFVDGSNNIALVLPKNIGQSVRMVEPFLAVRYGQLADITIAIPSYRLSEGVRIVLEFDARGFESFGPADLPLAFVKLNKVRNYHSIVVLRDTEALLTRQFEVGLPMVLAGISLVLDHAPGFIATSLFGVLKGLRSYLYSQQESHNYFLLILLINCLYFPMLSLACAKIIKLRFRKIYVAIPSVIAVVTQTGVLIAPYNYLFVSDLWTDMMAGIAALLVCGLGVNKLNLRRSEDRLQMSIGVLTTFGAIIASIAANAYDISLLGAASKEFSNPLHFALLPLLTVASLIGTGSVSNYVRQVRKKSTRLTEISKDMETALEIQKITMAEKKGSSGAVSWRAFWWPSKNLSGDAYDVVEVNFQGRVVQILCVIDVTGHGVASGISVSLILAIFKWWAEGIDLTQGAEMEKNQVLEEAPQKIESFLNMVPEVRGCTAGFAMIDSEENELTYCQAAHAGFFLTGEGFSEYLFSRGSTLGKEDHTSKSKSWTAKTIKLPENNWELVGFTDGAENPEVAQARWFKKLKNERPNAIKKLLAQMRRNKSHFRKGTFPEDDITMIVVSKR